MDADQPRRLPKGFAAYLKGRFLTSPVSHRISAVITDADVLYGQETARLTNRTAHNMLALLETRYAKYLLLACLGFSLSMLASYYVTAPPVPSGNEYNAYKAGLHANIALVPTTLTVFLVWCRQIDATLIWGTSNFKTHARPIAALALVAASMFICLSGRQTMGWMHRGVAGWVYAQVPSPAPVDISDPCRTIRTNNQIVCEDKSAPFSRPFQESLQHDNLRHLPAGVEFVSGNMGFLGFGDGKWLPWGQDLLAGSLREIYRTLDQASLIGIVRYQLQKQQSGKKGIMPRWAAYPDHVSYNGYDYSDYPDPAKIKVIEIWKVTAQLSSSSPRQANVVSAQLIRRIDVQ